MSRFLTVQVRTASSSGVCCARPSAVPAAALALRDEFMRRHLAKGILRSGNAAVQSRLQAQPPAEAQLATARVFYLQSLLKPEELPRLIADVPLVATSRDELLVLQDTSCIEGLPSEDLGLLTPRERRKARKKCIASELCVHALGGLMGRLKLRPPEEAANSPIVGISVGSPSFLVDYLEYQDFITDEGCPPEADPLFPHYFADTAGRPPTTAETLQQGGVALGCGRALNTAAFFRATVEDVTLWLTAFDTMVANRIREGHPSVGWLRAPPVGLDLVEQLPFAGDLLRLLVAAYEHVLATHSFQHLAVIEFPELRDIPDYAPPRSVANGVKFVSTTRDLLDFGGMPEEYIYGILNPGEVFCIPGNAYAYLNTDSMVGNNTDLRFVQSYIHNPYLMDATRYIPVDAADTVPR
eukprot:GGOE01042875.1.p1 GENE.GGOE01042875.1~~GGOE01042875.1.p1  ORF type:complete len:444 (-),score=129.24 GGOE01042875.1:535-1767(-)